MKYSALAGGKRFRPILTYTVASLFDVEIEKVDDESPEKIVKTWIDPQIGLKSYQSRKLAFGLILKGDSFK